MIMNQKKILKDLSVLCVIKNSPKKEEWKVTGKTNIQMKVKMTIRMTLKNFSVTYVTKDSPKKEQWTDTRKHYIQMMHNLQLTVEDHNKIINALTVQKLLEVCLNVNDVKIVKSILWGQERWNQTKNWRKQIKNNEKF